jgi:nitrogen regulatory protein P-II 1
MKRIEAIVRTHLLDSVKDALQALGIDGMTVVEIKGLGRQKGHTEVYRGSEYRIESLPKIKIDVALPDELLDPAIDAIIKSAKTGQLGDGKMFVFGMEDVIRVRTGEHGERAL